MSLYVLSKGAHETDGWNDVGFGLASFKGGILSGEDIRFDISRASSSGGH